MRRRSTWQLASVLGAGLIGMIALSGTAHAGPVELLNGVSIDASNPKNMVVPFTFGGNGMFLSQDGGETLEWLCAAGIATSANNRNAVTFSGGDGHIYLGLFDGLLRGDADGCNFAPVPELDKKYIRAITGDPIDPKRVYVATSNAMAENGIFMNDGSGTFKQLGTTAALFIDSLLVIKNGEARRYYETTVLTNLMTNEVKYSLRVSDDEGMTWTEETLDPLAIDPDDKSGPKMSVVAVDAKNPERVVANISRSMAADTLVMSTERGKAGTWKVVAKPTELGGVAFTPDGKLYFGDSDSTTRGLYVIESDGAEAKALNKCLRISCLGYDQANQRLLGCGNNYLFGPIDGATGVLKPLLDLRCAEHAVACADKPEIKDLCQPNGVEYCKLDHWLLAPMCTVYDRGSDFCTYATSQTFHCAGGFAVSNEAGDATDECAGMINTGDPNAADEDPVAMMCGGAMPAGAGAAGASAPATGAAGTSGAAAGSGSTVSGVSSGGAAGGGSVKTGSGGASAPASGGGGEKSSGGCSVGDLAAEKHGDAWSAFLAAIGALAITRTRRSKRHTSRMR